ncbi:hypothetical protein [Streptomyces chartreusis]|uniref:DNA polymerase IV n=1 Tax=Streptomyces chartreusis NRRL 3882 TaxID=1079985 RepID=A0A2N9BM53_STRCX|nr:DNA polymerase IV [Streptomyces chartreusis NRRL 3882]
MRGRYILHLRLDLQPDPDADLPERLRHLLENITPRVQMIEPDSAALDITGAIPYWKRDARGLTELVQLRVLAHFGLRSSAGCAPNRMLAAMACALTPPGQRTIVDDSPEAIAAFLSPRPARELPGVGAKTAMTLGEYGLHTVGDVVEVPSSRCNVCSGPGPAAPSTNMRGAATPRSSTPPRPRRASAPSTALSATSSTRPSTGAPCSPSQTTSVPACATPTTSPAA